MLLPVALVIDQLHGGLRKEVAVGVSPLKPMAVLTPAAETKAGSR
jgi:hypothetical protein